MLRGCLPTSLRLLHISVALMVKDQEASLLEASQFMLHRRENVNEGGETQSGWHNAGASQELCYSQPISAGNF